MKPRFFIERYSDDAITYAIQASVPQSKARIYDYRLKKLDINASTGGVPEGVKTLIRLGFDYIDIGTNADWVSAELPSTKSLSEEQQKIAFAALGELI